MTTEISLSTAISKSVVPAPTKTELVEALAFRTIALAKEEQAKAKLDAAMATTEAETAVLEYVASAKIISPPDVNLGWVNDRDGSNPTVSNVYVKYELDNLPTAVVKKLVKADKLNRVSICVPCLTDAKRMVRDQINGIHSTTGNRVGAMLGNAETVAALDKFLGRISK